MALMSSSKRKLGVEFTTMFLLLLAVFTLLLHGVFRPEQTLFSNDGPLGRLMTQCHQLPARFTGSWEDLNGIGFSGGTATPGISYGLQFLLKPLWFSKLYALTSLIILGLSAWCFLIQLRLAPAACILGGLAAAMNSGFFSVASWGVAAQAITPGMVFLALAALCDTSSRLRWWRVILAGLALGMGVIEGADMGAIYSIYVAAFVLYQAWIGGGTLLKKIASGSTRLALVALCAALMAAPALFSLIGTNIKGVTGMEQDTETKESRWDWATQWSLPVREFTGLVVPGLFGYRMDAPNGGSYWGEVGRTPALERYLEAGAHGPPPRGLVRFSGGGFYAGVLVVLLAVWAGVQSLRRKNSAFDLTQRRWLWFWFVIAFISTLLAFGRFAPFYQLVYALPYFSTIRNPVKFINLTSIGLIIVFAYGVDGLWRRYMQPAGPEFALRWAGIKAGWAKAGKSEKRWIHACVLVLGLSVVAWIKYASQHDALVSYLTANQFKYSLADTTASFSIRQVGWFVLFLVLSVGLMAGIFSGAFTGSRAVWGAILLGVLLLADLGRANLPWVFYWNYQQKYASNPIVDRLREKPYEHRVAFTPGQWPETLAPLFNLYKGPWLQQLFPYYNVQSLEIVDMPRMPEDVTAYNNALGSTQSVSSLQAWVRQLQLTSSCYVLGLADALDPLNQGIVGAEKQFRILERFSVVPKPGVTITTPSNAEQFTVVPDANGLFALFEFAGALPRAKLYANWQNDTNNQATLEQLANPAFDPGQSVFVAGELPAATSAWTNQPVGNVDIASYASKDIVLNSDAPSAAVLLLNNHYDPNWKVLVDGRPGTLLRCNFIMQGVYLAPGQHTVEFRFQPPFKLLYVGLCAIGAGLVILIAVIVLSPKVPAKGSAGV
jgi:hypothetical protein